MYSYLELIENVLFGGFVDTQRAKVNGQEIKSRVLLGQNLTMRLDLGNFPLITTKRVNFEAVKEELRWFLRGDDHITYLQNKKVKIWDPWADENGYLGHSYPSAWRHFGGHISEIKIKKPFLEGIPGFAEKKDDFDTYTVTDSGFDQIAYLVRNFRLYKQDQENEELVRNKRRLVLSGWDCYNHHSSRGPVGCHTLAQWHFTPQGLWCDLYMRSCDLFLGAPFNIASYALLTHLFAKIAGIPPTMLSIRYGNAHIYANHEEQIKEQLLRVPNNLPVLTDLVISNVSDDTPDSDYLSEWDCNLVNYNPYPFLKGQIAI